MHSVVGAGIIRSLVGVWLAAGVILAAQAQSVSLTVPAEIDAGQPFSYTIEVNQPDAAALADVVVRATLPELAGYAGFSAAAFSCTELATTPIEIECSADAALPQGATSLTLDLTAAAPPIDTDIDHLIALEVAGSEVDTASATSTVIARAELTLDKALLDGAVRVDSLVVRAGETLTVSILIENAGPSPAGGLRVSDQLPGAFVLDPAQTDFGDPDWACSASGPVGNQAVICSLAAELASGDTAPDLRLDLLVPGAAGDYSNQALGESDADDSDFPWASDTVDIEVLPVADLALAPRTSSAAAQAADSLFSYPLQVSNAGPSQASQLRLTDRVPAGAVLLNASGPGWTCLLNQLSGELDCSRATLDAGATSSVTVELRLPRNPPIAGQASGIISSGLGSISSSTEDPDSSNNQDPAFDLEIEAVWSLSLSKQASQPLVVPGQSFRYDIIVENFGPSDLIDDLRPELDDPFAPVLRGGLEVCGVSASDPCWTCRSAARPIQAQLLDTDVLALTGISAARRIALTPDRRSLFAASPFDNALARLNRQTTRNADFGTLSYSEFSNAATAPRALAVHPGGRWLLTVEQGSNGRLLAEAISAAGNLTGPSIELLSNLDEAVDLVFNRAGTVVYLAEQGADRIRVLGFDPASAAISAVGQVVRQASGGNPLLLGGVSRLALSADGNHLYAAAASDKALVGFSVNGGSGALTPLSSASLVPQVAGQDIAFTVVATGPVADEIYAGGDNRVLVIERDAASGLLGSFSATTAASQSGILIDGVSDLAVAPDGNSFYVAASADGALSLFARNQDDELVFSRSRALGEALQANALAIDSAGETLYLAASSGDAAGAVEPDRSLLMTFRIPTAAACDNLRLDEYLQGDIVDRPLAVPAGQRLVIEVEAGLDTGVTLSEVDNLATLTDALGAQLSDNALVQIRNATEISVVTSAPGERPIPGTDFAYTIEVRNDGPGGVSAARLTDLPSLFGPNPAGFIANTLEWQCKGEGDACCTSGGTPAQCGQLQPTAFVPGALNGHEVDLPADSRLVFTLRGRLHPASQPGATVSNTATVELPVGIQPFDPLDLESQFDVDMEAQVDLWVVKDSLGASDANGQRQVRYRVRVGNNGPSAAANLLLADALDDLSFDADAASWSCSISDFGQAQLADSCCDFEFGACQSADLSGQGAISQRMALAPGARAEWLIEVPVTDPGAAVVQNEVSVAAPPPVTDTDPTNNAAVRQVRLLATAELTIDKQVSGGGSLTPGEEVSFQITLQNEGPDDVPVTVQDILPESLDNVTWTCEATTPIPGDLSYSVDYGLGADLVEPVSVISSSDGRHVYVLGRGGEFTAGQEPSPPSLAVYARNIVPGPNFGQLSLIDLEVEGINDDDDSGLAVEGLAGASSMTLSPDQRHIYVAAGSPGAVVVFRRDSLTGSPQFGELTFVEARFNGSDQPGDLESPVTGLGGASAVAVSQDGGHVYVASTADGAVAVFRRQSGTGVLAFQGKLSAPNLLAQGVFALWGALAVDVSPDDEFVYVTGRGPQSRFSGPAWNPSEARAAAGARSYFVPNTDGVALKWLSMEQPIAITSSVDLTLSFEHIHSLDWATSCFDAGVLEISIDGGTSWQDVLEAGGVFIEGGYNENQNGAENNPLNGRPGWCRNSPGWGSGSFTPVEVDLSSAVSQGDSLLLRFGLGEGDVLGNPGWWIDEIELANAGGSLLIDGAEGDIGGATATVLSRIADPQALGYGDLAFESVRPLSISVDLATMDDQGENLYIGSADEALIQVLQRNPQSGALSPLETVTLTASADPPIRADSLSGLAALEVSPDGEHLIASGSAVDRLVVFRRLALDGSLQVMQELALGEPADDPVLGGIQGVGSIAVSSDGQQVFTAASVGQLGVFDRLAPDPTFGFLEAEIDGQDDGFKNIASGLLGARAAALSDDGNYVFVASFGQIASAQSGSLAVFRRDAGTTEPGLHLEFRQALRNGQGGVSGLDGALAISVFGHDIYLAAERSNALTHFRQDPTTGVVSFVASYPNGGAITGLSGAAAVAVSPGGEQVYAAGRFDHAVAIFERDGDTGALSFAGEARNGVAGVTGMLGANALAVSTDGLHVYVAARESDAVVVLDRIGNQLIHRQTFFDGTEGAVLTSPTGIAVSRETSGSAHVLVSSLDGDAVTVLRRFTDPTQPDLLGRVRFQQSLVDGIGQADALRSPRGIVVDPDNDRVYVASDDDDALVILDRNTSTGGPLFGNLTPLEIRRLGVGGVIGLDRPYGLAVSRGARRNIYAASLGGQSLSAFVRRSGSSCPAAGSGNLSEEVFIAAGGTIVFTITGTVNPGATEPLDNTAVIILDDDVTNTGSPDNASSPTATLTPRSELSLSKDNNRISLVAGQRQNYRIVLENAGPSHAREVAIADLLDPAQFAIDTAEWSCQAIGAGLLGRAETLSAENTSQAGLIGSAGVLWTAAPDPLLTERVYSTGVLGNGLAVFEVDPVTGELQPAPALDLVEGGLDVDGQTVSGLRGARSLVASDDGRLIYLVSQIDNGVTVIEVNTDDSSSPDFGGLRLRQRLDAQSAGLAGLNQPTGIVLSGDGEQIYVAAANSDAIYVFDRLPSGLLSLAQVVNDNASIMIDGVSSLTLGPEDQHLYAAGTNSAAVAVFARQPDGSLTHIQTRSSPATPGLTGVVSLALDPLGQQLYAIGRDAESIVVFNRDNDSASGQFGRLLSGTAQRITPAEVPDLVSPRSIVISSDGASAYVAAFGRNALLVFERERETGTLSFATRYVDNDQTIGLAGLSSLAFNPSGDQLVAGALLDNALTRFDRTGFSRCSVDSGAGNVVLTADVAARGRIVIDLAVDTAAGTSGQACPVELDPERQCVINQVTASLTQNSVTTDYLASDASFLERAANLVVSKSDSLAEFRGLAQATALAGTALDGSHLYVAAPGEPGLGVWALEEVVDAPTGDYPLRFVEVLVSGQNGVSQLNGISDVLVSPDGRHVYASSALDSALVAFEREPQTGRLSVQAVYSNNNGGVSSLSGPRALAMDASGRHLYAAAGNANAVVVFARQNDPDEPGFGNLTWQAALQNGTDGVQDMLDPADLALSPDGRHVYVAASGSDAVVTLRRQTDPDESDFGGLTWIQSRRNLIGDVIGLLGASRVLVAPDGEFVYAAGTGNSAVVVFDRVSSSTAANFGRLSFVGAAIDGSGGFSGLAAVSDLVMIGPGGSRLAVSSPVDSSVALLDRDPSTGLLSFADRIRQGDLVDDGSGPVEVDGLGGARALFALPNDTRLYAGSATPGAVTALDVASGQFDYAGAVIQGDGGAVPGAGVNYVIEVFNEGPSLVRDARLTDIFPPAFDQVSWTCTFDSPDSACPGAGSGNIDVDISVAAGDTVRFFATGQLRPDASGFVVNRARVALPAGVVDLDPSSSEAIDDDTIVRSRGDLAVTIDGLPSDLIAGSDLNYQLRVSNAGPSTARAARIEHRLPEAFAQAVWQCEADREPGTLRLEPAPPPALDGTRASAISGDGRHVYVVGDTSVPIIAVYARNTLDGSLGFPSQLIENLSLQPDPDGDLLVDGLAGARELQLSQDDRFVYVLGYDDDAIAVFQRDLVSGQLRFVQVLRDNIGQIDGLAGPTALAMDSNQDQVYVASELDDAITVFDRDSETGLLSYVETLRNGQGSIAGLRGPNDLLVSADDATLLVAAPLSSSLIRFQRAANGRLTWAGRLIQGELIGNGADTVLVDGLVGVRSLALSPDGRWLYSYGRDAGDQVLGVFEIESPSLILPARALREGDLVGVPPQPLTGLVAASELALTRDGRQLYLAGLDDLQGQRSLSALRVLEGADLQFLGRFEGSLASEPGQAHRLSVSADGRHLYGAGAGFDNLDIFTLLGGSICGRSGQTLVFDAIELEAGGEVIYDITTRVLSNARGPVTLEARVDAEITRQDPNLSNNLAVAGSNIVAAAALSVSKTRLTDPVVAGQPVVWNVEISNSGPSALQAVDVFDSLPVLPGEIANPMAAGVVSGSAMWSCNDSAHLLASQTLNDPDLAGTRGLAFSEDGAWAAAAAEDNNGVVLYQRDPVDGGLMLADTVLDGDPILDEDGVEIGQVDGLAGAFDVVFSPDGRHLVVGSAGADALAVFALDQPAARLIFIEAVFNADSGVVGLNDPVRLRFAPDGLSLYVAARASNALTVFQRQPVTGRLSWARSWRSGLDGLPVNALDGISDLVLSPDGRFIYAAATERNAIGIFARSESGSLSWSESLVNGQSQGPISVVGLGLVQSLAISPKGRHLYAASLSEDSLTLFERDTESGALSYVQRYVDGVSGLEHLDGANNVVVSPDGENVMASARNDQAISVFQRDPFSGDLREIEVFEDGLLGQARRLVLAPDGSSLLVSSGASGGVLANLQRRPEAYCGLFSSSEDTLIDSVDLAPGASLSYRVEALVHPGARGLLENTATITEPLATTALTPAAQSDTDSTLIEVVNDLSLVKTIDGEASALVGGGTARFVLEIANNGPSHAFSARITDQLPASIVSAEWSCQVLPAGGQSQCPGSGSGDLDEVVDVVKGERLLVVVDAQIDPDFLGQLVNTGQIETEAGSSDPDSGNNSSTVSATVSSVADLVISKSVDVSEALAGDPVRFTVEVTNEGPSSASSVAISDGLPPGFVNVVWTCSASATASCPAASGSGLLDEVLALPASGSLSFVIDADIDPFLDTPAELVNTALVATVGSEVTDPDLSNNQASASVAVSGSEADLMVSKTVDLSGALPGDVINYQITLANAGPSASIEARLIDSMPPELIDVSWVCTASGTAVCPAAAGSGDIDLTLALAPGSGLMIDIQATIDPATPAGPDQQVINTVSVSAVAGAIDPDPDNNLDGAATLLDLDVIFRDRFAEPEFDPEPKP